MSEEHLQARREFLIRLSHGTLIFVAGVAAACEDGPIVPTPMSQLWQSRRTNGGMRTSWSGLSDDQRVVFATVSSVVKQ